MNTRPLSHSYHSPLREENAARTRQAILEALGEQLAEEGLQEFSIPKVAKRAGVSVRTVYRYFPTREALLDSLSEWVNEKMGRVPYPESWQEIPATVAALFPGFYRHSELLRAQLSSPAGRELRLRAAHKRKRALERALAPLADGLSEREARRAGAVVHLLFSGHALLHMKDVWGFDDQEAVDASAWAIQLVFAELRRRRR